MPIKPALVGFAAVLAAGAFSTLPASAGAVPGAAGTPPWAQLSRVPAAQGRAVHYALARHVCSKPRPGEAACFAIRLVPATADTPGAKAYVSAGYATGPHGGYAPAALAAAYGFDPAAATNQTVAIIDAYNDPNARHDLNVFDAEYGLPSEASTSFRQVNQGGHASPLPVNDAGWSVEIALDIEAVRGVCNKCKIILVEANSPTNADLATAVRTAVRMGATEISNSYGGPELANMPASIRNAYNQPGIVVTASTGDDGWYGWDMANHHRTTHPQTPVGWSNNKPNAPAAYPTVVAVTGTALTLQADGTRAAETVWNENGLDDSRGLAGGFWQGEWGASGGGCSKIYTAPTWQSGVAGFSNNGCKGKRLAGDVAALGDPYTGFDVYNKPNGWRTYGGTSLSSPLIAAMWALAGGAGSEKYPAKSLYDNLLYRPAGISDVTVGGNAFCAGDAKSACSAVLNTQVGTGNPNNLLNNNTHYAGGWTGLLDCGYPYNGGPGLIAADKQCNARSGYDGASGVGAPDGLTMFQPTRITATIAGPAVLRLNTSQNWSATNVADGLTGATASSYSWSWGDGSPPSTGSATTHTFTLAGTHKVALTITDNVGQQGVFTRPITVGVPPTAVISGPTTVHVGNAATWRSSRSSDPNTGGKIVSRTWAIDGTQVATSAALAGSFNRTGTYTIKLTVVDNTGLVSRKTITVHVTR